MVVVMWRSRARHFGFVGLASLLVLPSLRAQRIYPRGADMMLEDSTGRVTSLGPGFNAVPISDHKFLFIWGARMGYGEESSCERPAARNRVVIYDAQTGTESPLFDKPLSGELIAHNTACVYEHADLSPSGSTLYIVTPCMPTAGCLAIVDLHAGTIRYVPNAMDVFVIRGGPRSGDLVYFCRLNRNPTEDDPRVADYRYVHARPDGSQIDIISGEDLVLIGGNAPAPILRDYLRRLHGRIFVQGEWIP
jgi:hypothetical protein